MTPPLPPGVEGHPVAPDVHTGCPEPDRDGWTEAGLRDALQGAWGEVDRLKDELKRREGERAALAIAVRGLRELEDRCDRLGAPYTVVGSSISTLLDKIGATR